MNKAIKEKRVKYRRRATNLLLAGLAIAFLSHLGLILKHKQLIIQEPNLWIIGIESVFFLGCIWLAWYNTHKGD